MTDQQARIVYENVAEGSGVQGKLFDGLKFWIAQRCPMRSSFVDRVKSNGGQVVPLEKQADYLIVDHMRNDLPPGAISYRFIEASIRNGKLENPEDHRAGPAVGTVREVGSIKPTKTGRNPYTVEDDRVLYKWVTDHVRSGGKELGNEIYKQLEAVNNRHPWQSWRDRYIKYLKDKPPAGYASENMPTTPQTTERRVNHSARASRNVSQGISSTPNRRREPAKFIAANFDDLLRNAEDIENVRARNIDESWKAWAETLPEHTAKEWHKFYRRVVRPIFLDIEDQPRRRRRYNQTWRAWYKEEQQQSAEEWVEFYEANVLPLFEEEEEQEGKKEVGEEKQSSHPRKKPPEPKTASGVSVEPPATELEGESVIRQTSNGKRRWSSKSPKVLIYQSSKDGGTKSQAVLPVPTTVADSVVNSRPVTDDAGAALPPPEPQIVAARFDAVQSSQLQQSKKRFRDDDEIEESPVKGKGLGDGKRQRLDNFDGQDPGSPATKQVVQSTSTTVVQAVEQVTETFDDAEEVEAGVEVEEEEVITELRTDSPADIISRMISAMTDSEKAALLEELQESEDEGSDDDDKSDKEAILYAEGGNQQVFYTAYKQRILDLVDDVGDDFPRTRLEGQVHRITMQLLRLPNEQKLLVMNHISALSKQSDGKEVFTKLVAPLLKQAEELEKDELEPVDTASQVDQDTHEEAQPSTLGQPASPSLSFRSGRETLERPYVDPEIPATQDTDLGYDLPPPEGGWHTVSSLPKSAAVETHRQRPVVIDTQAILNAETQLPDLDMPDPDDEFEEDQVDEAKDVQRSPTPVPDFDLPEPGDGLDRADTEANRPTKAIHRRPPSSPLNRSPSPPPVADTKPAPTLTDHINNLVSAGHSEALIIEALRSTSTNVPLAIHVLSCLESGRGIPKNRRGVWTAEDDVDLENGDSRGIERVDRKHGWDGPGGCQGRLEFLKQWRA